MPATESKWWDESWNPIRYLDGWMCTKTSPGCANCYAEKINLRFGNGIKYQPLLNWKGFRLDERVLDKPLHWRKPQRIFVMDMGDLFHEDITIDLLTHIFDTIEQCPQHTFLILTKRPENIKRLWTNQSDIPGHSWRYMREGTILPNVWWGVTVESEDYLWRINELLQNVPAAHKFLSAEPLLGPLDLHLNCWVCTQCGKWTKSEILSDDDHCDCDYYIEERIKNVLNWVVVGPETGPRRRPCKVEWLESIVDQCDAAKVPVWVKAYPMPTGKISHDPAEWPEKLRRRDKQE